MLLGVIIWVEDGSQPALKSVHDYLIFSRTLVKSLYNNKHVKFVTWIVFSFWPLPDSIFDPGADVCRDLGVVRGDIGGCGLKLYYLDQSFINLIDYIVRRKVSGIRSYIRC